MSPFPASAQAVSSEYLKKHLETFQKYYRALRKAVVFIDEHPNEAKRILPKYTDLEMHVAEQSNMYKWEFDEDADRTQFQRLADLYYSKGILTRRIDVESMFVPLTMLGTGRKTD